MSTKETPENLEEKFTSSLSLALIEARVSPLEVFHLVLDNEQARGELVAYLATLLHKTEHPEEEDQPNPTLDAGPSHDPV